nr:hypothetical protein [uncultured Devosia sp.]
MRHCVIAASLLLTTSAPALAQNLDALRDGLNHLPATVLVQQQGDVAYFVDVKTTAALGEKDAAVRPYFRLLTGAEINALNSLPSAEPSEWEAKAGTTIDRLRYFTAYGQQPDQVSLWGLVDNAAATDMIATLESLGFENAGVPGVVGNGEPRRQDFTALDPSNPWITGVGASQFAAAKGTNVIQANTPQTAMLVAAEQPSLGENPIVQTALAGLEQSVGDSAVVQAVVISPLFGMTGVDPASVLMPSADIEETRKRLEEQMAALGKGIPPYLGGILTDLQGEQAGVGIALAYPDCAIAQTAANAIAMRWGEMADDAAQGDIVTGTAEGEDGLCAATVNGSIDTDSPERNPAYRAIIDPYFSRGVGILQIGQS